MVFGFGNKGLLSHPSMYATAAKGATSAANTKTYDYGAWTLDMVARTPHAHTPFPQSLSAAERPARCWQAG